MNIGRDRGGEERPAETTPGKGLAIQRAVAHRKGSVRQSGLALQGTLVAIVVFGIALSVILYVFGANVPPGAMGVRQIFFGPGQGFHNKALLPGYHWRAPFYSEIHLLPQTLRLVEFSREDPGSAPLRVKTADGAEVDVDVTVLARIYDMAVSDEEAKQEGSEMAHAGPGDLIERLGLTNARWVVQIQTLAAGELRRTLSRLSASDFYDAKKREAATREATLNIRKGLAPFGIGIDSVLLRRYTYRNAQIDEAIFQKNLQEVQQRLNEAKSEFAEVEAKLTEESAMWDAKIATLRIEGESNAQRTRSEANLVETEKRAQGDLEVARAQAEVDRLQADALASAQGAEIFVARQMAPVLDSLRGGVVTNLDPYDIGEWVKKLGVAER